MSELYHPPAFLFYVDDFVSGTVDLTPEEIGIYVLLLGYQWGRGAIPADTPAMARIARTTPGKMKSAWKSLQRCFRPSTDGDGLQNARLESVREKMQMNAEANRQRGLRGAQIRWKKTVQDDAQALVEQCSSIPQAMPEECVKNGTPLSVVHSPNTPSGSPPLEFALWFYKAAVASDVLQPVADERAWAHRQRGEALEFLQIYGPEKGAARALAFIRAIATKKIHRAPTLRFLRECAEYREVTAELARSVPPAGAESATVRRLRAAQERGA